MLKKGVHWLGLFYAAIPVLTAVYDAYQAVTHDLEQQGAVDWLAICINEVMPRLGFGLILGFVV